MRHTHFGPWGHHEPYGKLPPFRFWLQTSLPAIYDDSLTYLELAGRLQWYIEQIINTLKVYDDKFCELMGLYKELECYVNDYFDSIDFPEMVKDVLDDMAATGKLAEILAESLPDFTLDPKKIKGGIVPVHYTWDRSKNGIEYFKRTETDEEVLYILRNGSILMGVFKGSPAAGDFIAFMQNATCDMEGTVKTFECGCVNTVYSRDFTVNYKDYIVDGDGFIRRVDIIDRALNDTQMNISEVYAELPDHYVTEPKLSEAVAEKLNKTYTLSKEGDQIILTGTDGTTSSVTDEDTVYVMPDHTVTPVKLHENVPAYVRSNHPSKYILIGDSYAARTNSWITQLKNTMCLTEGENCWSASADGAGFTASTTFQSLFQNLLNSMTAEECNQITDVIVLGGWNDGSLDIKAGLLQFLNVGNAKLPYAKYHLGFVSWVDSQKYQDSPIFAMATACQNYIDAANYYGINYIGNMQYVMHDYANFSTDGLHPNETGVSAIATALATYLRGGDINVVKSWRVDNNPAWDSNVEPHDPTKVVISTWLDNNMCGAFLSHTHYHFKTAVNFSGHPSDDEYGKGWTKLFDFSTEPLIRDNKFHGAQQCVNATYYDGTYYYDRPTWIRVNNGGVEICPISANNGEAGAPYKAITGVTDVIFQVGAITLETWSFYG